MIFKCFDLETTSTDVATCEVVQAAIVEAPRWSNSADDPDGIGLVPTAVSARSMLFFAATIPAGAQAVHGITPEKVADAPPFIRAVRSFVAMLTEPDVVSVSFNGCGYDLPIVARYMSLLQGAALGRSTAAEVEQSLRARHIDVMRLWQRARAQRREPTWRVGGQSLSDLDYGGAIISTLERPALNLHAECFSGTLTAAHAFWLGEVFDSAHDATADCMATLRVLDAMLREGFVDVETAVRWSNEPMPGDVDFAGKLKWQGDTCVMAFGKHNGTPIEHVDGGFLQWMLRNDFPEETKQIVRRFMAGEYPQRKYEDESERT
jgi:DNA polymerase III epsilon subunit-like protein